MRLFIDAFCPRDRPVPMGLLAAAFTLLACAQAVAKQPAQQSKPDAPAKCTGLTAGEVVALQKAGKMKYGPYGKGQGYAGTGYSSNDLASAYYTGTAPGGGMSCK